jgi:hypothetical protein
VNKSNFFSILLKQYPSQLMNLIIDLLKDAFSCICVKLSNNRLILSEDLECKWQF